MTEHIHRRLTEEQVRMILERYLKKGPKIRFRILGKLTRRPKDKAAGDFATSHTITRMVRSKIAENAVFRDVLSV